MGGRSRLSYRRPRGALPGSSRRLPTLWSCVPPASWPWPAKPRRAWPERLRWWALSCGLITLAPFVHIRWGLRTGRFSDPDISVREERCIPYLAQLATLGVTYGLLRWLHAPRLVVAVVTSVAGAIVVMTGVTTVWKMSMHLTGAAGTATVLVLLYGRRALPLMGLVPLVAWSRYVLDHHTPAQALAGAALGAAMPVLVFHQMDPLHTAAPGTA